MKLRFPESKIEEWADRYSYAGDETGLLSLRDEVQRAGYLTQSHLKQVARWKSPRSAPHVERNSSRYVEEVSRFAFSTSDERARVESLTLLDGVSWPTASVILHLFHRDDYPILDFRALWSVNSSPPNQYDFEFWMPYVQFCRKVASRNGVSMRTLDRALWQFSKANQSKS